MRIMTKREFLAMPAGTVFSNFQPIVFDGLFVKGENTGVFDEQGRENDFWYTSMLDDLDSRDSGEFSQRCDEAREHDVPLVFGGVVSREGYYDDTTLYAVWSDDDVKRCAAFLSGDRLQRP